MDTRYQSHLPRIQKLCSLGQYCFGGEDNYYIHLLSFSLTYSHAYKATGIRGLHLEILIDQMVRALGMNPKIVCSSPAQIETFSISKTLTLSEVPVHS